jgi:hypothetical protein
MNRITESIIIRDQTSTTINSKKSTVKIQSILTWGAWVKICNKAKLIKLKSKMDHSITTKPHMGETKMFYKIIKVISLWVHNLTIKGMVYNKVGDQIGPIVRIKPYRQTWRISYSNWTNHIIIPQDSIQR